MPSRHEIVSSITFKTTRYPYKLNKDGTRNINRDFDKDEDFLFKFGINELSLIIFRDSPNKLNIDNKEMYFDYNGDKLIGIHFENEDYIWIVKDYESLLDDCKKLYASQLVAIEMMDSISGNNNPFRGVSFDDYLGDISDEDIPDEFDLEDDIE